ncbi:MAG: hypothetical protein BGP16_10095 [Sphingobium sp. 66-54]|nr:MAG: hypothetical protein BGP16_10095 [Sphingobium sp. 66-54]
MGWPARVGLLALAGALLPVSGTPTAWAQDNTADSAKDGDKDKTQSEAERVATQPVRDVGIARTSIDPVLQEALKAPYAPAGNGRCAAINAELTKLNAALGPDFDGNAKANEDKAERLALAGGEMLVNTLIPFRGLVREISGAAPAERRKASAISAGTARRGYLRGLAQMRQCKAVTSAAGK